MGLVASACNADVDEPGLFGQSAGQGEAGNVDSSNVVDGGDDDHGTGGTVGASIGGTGEDATDDADDEGTSADDDGVTSDAVTAGPGTTDDTGDDTGDDGADGTGCMPGDTRDCYTGPANTENVGECMAGAQQCSGSGAWESCEDEVLPGTESCNGLDDDCNGTPDDGNPEAGDACSTGLPGPCADGVTVCEGGAVDCESVTPPAAAETCGNQEDDDCNGAVDDGCECDPLNPLPGCGAGLQCQPQTDDTTECIGPMGTGTQYTACTGLADCSPLFACIQTTVANAWCMQWCFSDAHCGIFDSCTSLAPQVFAGGQEYGVCWDGLP